VTLGRIRLRQSRAFFIAPLMCLVMLAAPGARAQEVHPAKNVLVLYSFSDPSLFEPLDSLKAAIRARVHVPVNFYAEYMDTQRFEDADYEKSVADSFRHAYSAQRIDLVMVAAYPALRFALQHRDQIFPGVPIVFFYVHGGRLLNGKPPQGVTGVTETIDVRGSLKLAFLLQPTTRRVAVVTGTTEFETYWLEIFRREFRPYQNTVGLTELVGLPTDQLLEHLAELPADTAVFVQLSPQSSKLPAFGTYDGTYAALAAISERYRTYCIFSSLCLDRGGIGGSYPSGNDQDEKAALAASRILAGEKPENVPVAENSETQVRVDWRQLRRWNIPEGALPPASLVLYREASVWQQYQGIIIGVAIFIALQAFLIAGLVRQRMKRRKIEANLVASEERFRVMAEAAPALIWMSDPQGRITYLNKRSLDFTGAAPEALLGEGWVNYVHADDLNAVLATSSVAMARFESCTEKYRLRRKDGVYRWMLDVRSPRFNTNGSFAGFIGSAVDISDQRTAQDALEKLGGRLIEAQEQERSRIARELHDDICQRLAILTVEIEQSITSLDSRWVQEDRMQKVWQHCSEITGDVQALSHALHSSMLDHLGVVAATRNFCNEFSAKHGVVVSFTHVDVPSPLPRNVSLCLFRVTQEALHNAVKHSGVRLYEVELRGSGNGVNLAIRDAGIGLDIDRVKRNGGLGLISMEERVHLVKGTFAIDSKLGGGTTIRVTVPLVAKPDESIPNSEKLAGEGLQYASRSNTAG
jgi:PAS domain S-box-containing protein